MMKHVSVLAVAVCAGTMMVGCVHGGGSLATVVEKESSTLSYAKPGFYTELDENGRLWVFHKGSEGLKTFKAHGEPAKIAIRPGAGPGGITLKSIDSETITSYLAAKPGFYTELDENGRLWVFHEGSEGLKTFKAHGEPAKIAIRPGAGPGGITLKSIDMETIIAYATAKPGFATELDEHGRLWVFHAGSEGLANFKKGIEPAKHVIRPAAGPLGLTLKALDTAVLDAYQAAK